MIEVKSNDHAQVWFDIEFDSLFIRHVIHEGEFGWSVCDEFDKEFAPHMEYNNFYFIGVL